MSITTAFIVVPVFFDRMKKRALQPGPGIPNRLDECNEGFIANLDKKIGRVRL